MYHRRNSHQNRCCDITYLTMSDEEFSLRARCGLGPMAAVGWVHPLLAAAARDGFSLCRWRGMDVVILQVSALFISSVLLQIRE